MWAHHDASSDDRIAHERLEIRREQLVDDGPPHCHHPMQRAFSQLDGQRFLHINHIDKVS
jgi:hypothetical protein